MELKNLEKLAKNTVGYSEASNKRDFIVGLQVGYSIYSEETESQISQLTRDLEYYKSLFEGKTKELETLAGILNKYT